jgi:hypothetical protein
MPTRPKRPRDTNQLAKRITDLATGDAKDKDPDEGKNQAAVALGRLGGLKGGKARAKQLSVDQLSEIGKKGVQAKAAKRAVTVPPGEATDDHGQSIRPKKKRRAVIQAPED